MHLTWKYKAGNSVFPAIDVVCAAVWRLSESLILKSLALLLQLQSGWVGLPPGDRRASMGSSLPPYAKHPHLFPGCVRQVCILPMPRVYLAN